MPNANSAFPPPVVDSTARNLHEGAAGWGIMAASLPGGPEVKSRGQRLGGLRDATHKRNKPIRRDAGAFAEIHRGALLVVRPDVGPDSRWVG